MTTSEQPELSRAVATRRLVPSWAILLTGLGLALMTLAGCGDNATGDQSTASTTATPDSADGSGAAGTTSSSDSTADTAEKSGTPSASDPSPVPSSTSPSDGTTQPEDEPEDEDEAAPTAVVVLAGGVTDEFRAVIQSLDRVRSVSTVEIAGIDLTASTDSRGGTVDQTEPGFVIQLDARAYPDPRSARGFAPELMDALSRLEPDQVVLSESSAALRRLDTGSTMTLSNGAQFLVGRVLPDEVVGSAEVVLVGPDAMATAGAASTRQVALVDYDGTGEELERRLLAANGGEGVRVFGGAGGDDQGDRDRAVLAQLRIKEQFGEFSFRPGSGRSVEIDPAWVEANIVTVDFPLLGPAKCHRRYGPILVEVLQGLIDDGLSDVIDPAAFQGCWNPRFIGGSTRLSRHAWGVAADINFFNPLDGGPGSPVHPELLERMAAAGVTSGHNWSSPDPGHFEFLREVERP